MMNGDPSNPNWTTRIGRHFQHDLPARLGLWMLVALYLVAAFAPFLANGHALLLWSGGKLSFPVFRTMEPIEWRFLTYTVGVGALVVGRAYFMAKKWRLAVGVALVFIAAEAMAALVPEVNDLSSDREATGFKIMPLIPYSPGESGPLLLSPPSWDHIFGTDLAGHDTASRLIHGARSSLSIAVVAQLISLLIGVTVGMLSGYYKRWIDLAATSVMNVLDCFPWLLLVLVIVGLFGSQNNMIVIMLVLGATGWTPLARLVRAEALRLSAQPFTLAAQALGASDRRILGRHLLPNIWGLILVNSTFGVASIILAESSLDFLGFGLQAPTASWGDTLASGEGYLDIAWWLTFFPGMLMFLSIMVYNFVGEGLRDSLETRTST